MRLRLVQEYFDRWLHILQVWYKTYYFLCLYSIADYAFLCLPNEYSLK